MARPRRTDFPGCWHHVMHRGARREPIFRRPEHCELFLGCLQEAVERYGIEVHAYALMPNHYHLLVRSPLGNLSRAMRQVNGAYTQRLNRRQGWDGPVFRGRFRSQMVGDGAGLKHVFAYIHLNPLRANLVRRLEDSRWTSLRAYLGNERRPGWLTTDVFGRSLGGPRGVRHLVERLRKRPEEWPEGMDLEAGWLRGAEAVRPEPMPPIARQSAKRQSVSAVLARACAVAGCSAKELKRAAKGPRANPARRFAVWAMSRAGGYGPREVGEALGMSEGHVSKVLERLRRQPAPAPLGQWMRELVGKER